MTITYEDDGIESEKVELSKIKTRKALHALFVEKGFQLKPEDEIEKLKSERDREIQAEIAAKAEHKLINQEARNKKRAERIERKEEKEAAYQVKFELMTPELREKELQKQKNQNKRKHKPDSQERLKVQTEDSTSNEESADLKEFFLKEQRETRQAAQEERKEEAKQRKEDEAKRKEERLAAMTKEERAMHLATNAEKEQKLAEPQRAQIMERNKKREEEKVLKSQMASDEL